MSQDKAKEKQESAIYTWGVFTVAVWSFNKIFRNRDPWS